MQLPHTQQTMPNKPPLHTTKEDKMNLDNRRLIEIQKEKQLFKSLLDNAESISDCLTYTGKLELLEKEEKQILKRNDVII